MITDEREKELDELAADIYMKIGDAHREFAGRINEINAKHLEVHGEELEYVKDVMREHPILSVLVLARNPDDEKKFGESTSNVAFIAGKLTNFKLEGGASLTGNQGGDALLCSLHLAHLAEQHNLDSLSELASIAETAACLFGKRIEHVQDVEKGMAKAADEVLSVVADRMVEEAARKGGQA